MPFRITKNGINQRLMTIGVIYTAERKKTIIVRMGREGDRMKKFLVLSQCCPEYNRIVEADDISEVADHYYDSCYGIIEISQDEVTE